MEDRVSDVVRHHSAGPSKNNSMKKRTNRRKLTVPKPIRKPNPKAGTNIERKKKNQFRAPRSIFIPIASNEVFYKGSYFARGDVVSLVNAGDSRVYYAQIRGLLKDQYEEKCAVLTWLLPTQGSPEGRFDPNTYIVGPEDETPRKLECIEFVCHSPSEYFMATKPSVPEIPEKPVCGYAWTSKGPKIVTLPAEDFSTDSD